MKTILGLDLGTNSIGWALVNINDKKILGMGSRIIPMGTDKQDYEKGVGITKNASRREKRNIRKLNKRYKLRRNKLLFVLNELGMLPEQFQFKNGLPEANKIQTLELLPIKKGTMQLDSLQHYQLKANAISNLIGLKEFGKILYNFNQLRGYAGGNNEDESKKKGKEEDDGEENCKKKSYEVIKEKVLIKSVEKSEDTFKGGKNKSETFFKYNITIVLNGIEIECWTKLQNLEEKKDKEEELEIRIKRPKKGDSTYELALPQRTNWRKQMESFEERIKDSGNSVSQEVLKILKENKWTKVRNRVVLRHRYEAEFDSIWERQAIENEFLNNCPKEKLEKIANYLFPGNSETQTKLRKESIDGGLKYIIKEQIIYYQRPLKSQTDLINKCQFEKDESVLANSHPLFQEFRCWDQINRMYITSKQEVYNEKKKKNVFQYTNRFLTQEEKQEIYSRLQVQKQLGYGEVRKIIQLEDEKGEFLNGLNSKAKLKGCDTLISIKKVLGENFVINNDIIISLWNTIFENANNGNEYDPKSVKVSSIKEVLKPLMNDLLATELALKFAQNVKFPRKYASLSEKAILNILPLMQLYPTEISESLKAKFHLIETGEVSEEFPFENLEDYVVNFIQSNYNALQTGGLMYSLAASLVYGKHTKAAINKEITNYHDINYVNRNLRNSIVEQISNETMQVVKAIWKEYNFNPEELEIRIELARDLKNSAVEREKIYKGQINNQKINETIKKRLIELKQDPTQGNIELYKIWSRQNKEEYPKQSKEPTLEEIQKLRLWEEQKCISPYTLKPIPLSKLFSLDRLYDIDHIVPKSRYFDDSVSNKVVCETNINEEKSNRTAWEYISQQNSAFDICTIENYLSHIESIFYGKKKKNLLLEKIPTNPVERQIKDTQYISVAVKNELAKIVGSDNVKTSTGEVTSFLRSRWGLKKLFMELTESRFKQMELWDLNKETGMPNTEWINKYYDKEKQKHIYEIKNWSKRFDHRHHSIDALVVALTNQSHIQRLNNLNKYLQDELTKRKDEFNIQIKEDESIIEAFFNMEKTRREEIQKKIESSRYFEKPFDDIVIQAKEQLEKMIISHKPKDKLGIKVDEETGKKQLKIRASLHQETYYGKSLDPKTNKVRDTKTIGLSSLGAKDIPQILDEVLKNEIDNHRKKYESIKEAFTGEGMIAFNENRFQTKKPTELKPPVFKVKVWYTTKETATSTLQRLYENNIKKGVITGDNYLFLIMEKNRKRVFDIATLFDSADIAKESLKENDTNYRNKIAEYYRLKHKEKPDKVLFTLQQNDLVYLPEIEDPILNFTTDEFKEWIYLNENKTKFSKRIYKVVKFTGKDCFFIPHNYSMPISIPKDLTEEQRKNLKELYKDKSIPKQELNYKEFGSFDSSTKTEVNENFVKEIILKKEFAGQKNLKIQDSCIKIQTDWLGNIKLISRE
ncbi:type II CRISPR RNA-guided endonuclease Cas9 [Pedobacter alpinus]|uniref:CRISPR-associated endonuclease Cas9 n=1 Tax=Pedobacter alpinus TaxID=1590643 RepID=A0ABW5TV18_9SPHI